VLENYIYFLKNHPCRAFWSALGVVLLGVLLVCFGFFFLNSEATFLIGIYVFLFGWVLVYISKIVPRKNQISNPRI